jgi:NAD(P)-dependent dehydrogenase (short-subunit alcohol dehydrogenase family)
MGRLEDKVAIITGGASGLGEAIARRFAGEGAAVVIADVDEAGGERLVAAIAGEGGRARFVATDVTRAAACARLVEATVAEFGRLDVMVNNAGVGSLAPIAELEEAEWDRILAVDLKGVFLGARYAFPALVSSGGGVILNMASVAGLVAAPGFGAYGAAKAGVIHLTRVLALEGAPHGIRANALCPTWTETPMVRSYLAADPQPQAARLRLEESIPLGRLAAPEDVACAALYLASDEAAFITGVILEVDGGVTARWGRGGST